MSETALTKTAAPTKWSTAGAAVTMTAVDNANGNKFVSAADDLLIVQNTHVSALSIQVTSQPHPATLRTGSINQSLAAGEIRVFRMTRDGWADANGNVLLPTGLNVLLKVGIVTLD